MSLAFSPRLTTVPIRNGEISFHASRRGGRVERRGRGRKGGRDVRQLRNTLVPSLDNSADPDGGDESLTSVSGRVELVTVGSQGSDVCQKKRTDAPGQSARWAKVEKALGRRGTYSAWRRYLPSWGSSGRHLLLYARTWISDDDPEVTFGRGGLPGAIRSTVTPMLIADVVKVRLGRVRKMGTVLESIELWEL